MHNISASISSLFTLYFSNIIFAASTAKSDAHSLGSAIGRLDTPILFVKRTARWQVIAMRTAGKNARLTAAHGRLLFICPAAAGAGG